MGDHAHDPRLSGQQQQQQPPPYGTGTNLSLSNIHGVSPAQPSTSAFNVDFDALGIPSQIVPHVQLAQMLQPPGGPAGASTEQLAMILQIMREAAQAKTLDLRIAEEHRREREAALELARLDAAAAAERRWSGGPGPEGPPTNGQQHQQQQQAQQSQFAQPQGAVQGAYPTPYTQPVSTSPVLAQSYLPSSPLSNVIGPAARAVLDPSKSSASPYAPAPSDATPAPPDFSNLDSLLEQFDFTQPGRPPLTDSMYNNYHIDGPFPSQHNPPSPQPSEHSTVAAGGPAAGASAGAGAAVVKKKAKKQAVEVDCACANCGKAMAKLFLRGEPDDFNIEYKIHYLCNDCAPAQLHAAPSGTRKRGRGDDSDFVCCDVCGREQGSGGAVSLDGRSPITFQIEYICLKCWGRYQRCSDCGGGGGGRIGIGKWRAKQLFVDGRKTCSLSHVRIGSTEMELGVKRVPHELGSEKEQTAILALCKTYWTQRLLSRLAVPDNMENDSGLMPLREWSDVVDLLDASWPTREQMLREERPGGKMRRYACFTWARVRSRRERGSHSAAHPSSPPAAEEASDRLFPNLSVTPVLIPAQSELVGLTLAEWDMENGTLLIECSMPQEGQEGDDRAAFCIGKIATKVIQERTQVNVEHQANPSLGPMLPPLQHLFVVTPQGLSPETYRLSDFLIRRRGFLPLDEYILRHPHVDRRIFEARASFPCRMAEVVPCGKGGCSCHSNVFVKWLGADLNMDNLQELKKQELGKARGRKTKSRGGR